jgi:hypothetical protein
MIGNSDVGTAAGGQEPTRNRVKKEGSRVAHSGVHAGEELAHTAVEQGMHVAEETGRKARGVVDQAQARLKEEAGDQQKRAATGLGSIADQLRSMAEKCGQQDTASKLVHQASGRVQQVADWLEEREPGQVVEEVRNFARRHPGAFLAGAAMAGALAGRLTRNMASGVDQDRGVMGRRDASQPETEPPRASVPQPPTPSSPPASPAAGVRT